MKKTIDYYLTIPYRMEVIPDAEEGGFTVWYPDLPGCLTCSETVEGAMANAQDAKLAWIKAALEAGLEIPVPSVEDNYYSSEVKRNGVTIPDLAQQQRI